MSAEGEGVDLGDLHDHPNGRVMPGFEPDSRSELRKLVEEADGAVYERFHGLTVVATTTVQVFAEDEGVAGRVAVDNVDAGDLYPGWYGWPEEIAKVEEEKLVKGWYYRQDDEYPLYEARLVAGGRFYMWAGDSAQVGEVAPQIIDAGDFGFCIVVNDWLSDVEKVDVRRLAVEKVTLERYLEKARGGEGDVE